MPIVEDDPKDVAREVPRPDLNSWTENDPPRSKKARHRPPRDSEPDPMNDKQRVPGKGEPDAQETYRQGRQGPK